MLAKLSPWHGRKYFLDRMSLGDLTVAFFTHHSILVYLGLAALAVGYAVAAATDWTRPRSRCSPSWSSTRSSNTRCTAGSCTPAGSTRTPGPPRSGSGCTTTTTRTRTTSRSCSVPSTPPCRRSCCSPSPVGWSIGGAPAAALAIAAGCLIFAGYEFCHCVQHLPFTPKNAWLREIKKHHLAHHFHSERGNYGITLDLVDRILGTGYASPRAVPRSATTHNLGYDEAERERYPWVAELSASDDEYAVLRTRRRLGAATSAGRRQRGVDRGNHDRAFADRRRDALDRAGADVADSEHAVLAGLQDSGRLPLPPCAAPRLGADQLDEALRSSVTPQPASQAVLGRHPASRTGW